MTINNAAVLPTSTYHGTQYYYFAVEKNGSLSTFGGGKKRSESVEECAVREFSEESLKVFGRKRDIKKLFDHPRRNSIEKVNNAAFQNITYVVPLKLHHNPMKKFDRARRDPNLRPSQKEIKEIIPVEASKLVKRLSNGKDTFHGHKLRHCVKKTLDIALRNKQL